LNGPDSWTRKPLQESAQVVPAIVGPQMSDCAAAEVAIPVTPFR
jgi:hypothetical protein